MSTRSRGCESYGLTTLALPFPARLEHRVVVVDAGVTPGNQIIASVIGGDTDENSVDMDPIAVRAIAGEGQWTAVVVGQSPLGGQLKLLYQVM